MPVCQSALHFLHVQLAFQMFNFKPQRNRFCSHCFSQRSICKQRSSLPCLCSNLLAQPQALHQKSAEAKLGRAGSNFWAQRWDNPRKETRKMQLSHVEPTIYDETNFFAHMFPEINQNSRSAKQLVGKFITWHILHNYFNHIGKAGPQII